MATSRNVSCFPEAKYRYIHMYLTVRVEQCHCGIPEYNVSQMTYDIIYGSLIYHYLYALHVLSLMRMRSIDMHDNLINL